jgi:hypothetical protein
MKAGVVVHACNPSTQETEAGGLQIRSQPGKYGMTCLKKKKIRQYLWEEGPQGLVLSSSEGPFCVSFPFLNKYLLTTYYVADTVLEPENTAWPSWSPRASWACSNMGLCWAPVMFRPKPHPDSAMW